MQKKNRFNINAHENPVTCTSMQANRYARPRRNRGTTMRGRRTGNGIGTKKPFPQRLTFSLKKKNGEQTHKYRISKLNFERYFKMNATRRKQKRNMGCQKQIV